MRRKLILQIGAVFGNFTIISQVIGKGKTKYWVKCICGKEKIIFGTVIKSGMNKSCGCLTIRGNTIKHNLSRSSEYSSWCSMLNRCYNINVESYCNYGARGIIVCDSWRNSFQNFINDMGMKPDKKYSIDRINNDGNYEPSNCKWATHTEQANNRRNNRFLKYKGEVKTIKQWAKIFDIGYTLISYHLRNMDFETYVNKLISDGKINQP